MANPDHGKCDCPVCGAPGASVRVNKKERAYVHCDACMVQIQARGPLSDSAIRGRVKDVGDSGDSGSYGGSAGAVVAPVRVVADGEANARAEKPARAVVVREGRTAGRARQGSNRIEKPAAAEGAAAAVPQASQPAKPKAAAVIHTAEGGQVQGVPPAVPEFNIIDGIAGLFK